MKILIAHEFTVRSEGHPLPVEELHAEGERLMDALLDLASHPDNADIDDPTTSTDGEHGTVTVELMVTAIDDSKALARSQVIVRTAIHAIGGTTPQWEQPVPQRSSYHPEGVQLVYA